MYLDTISALLTGETHKYIGSYSDEHDNIICLTTYGSVDPSISFDKKIIRYPKFQILIRDQSYTNGYSRAESILSTLNCYYSSGLSIEPISDILDLGKDNNNRSVFVINFKATIIN